MATKQAVDRLAILCALAAPPLTGCANGIPKGTLSYFLPKAQTTLTVTQTLTCNAAGDALFQVVTVNNLCIPLKCIKLLGYFIDNIS